MRLITPLEKVFLVWKGQTVEEIPLSFDRKSADFQKTLKVDGSGWYHLRAEGKTEDRFPLDSSYAQAFTNPVWILVGERPVRSRADAEYGIQWIDKLRAMAEAWKGWRSEKEKSHVFAQFEEAKAM